MSQHHQPGTTHGEPSIDRRVENIMAHLRTQLDIQRKIGQFARKNPIIISADDTITLLGYLSRNGLDAHHGDPRSIAHPATILIGGNN